VSKSSHEVNKILIEVFNDRTNIDFCIWSKVVAQIFQSEDTEAVTMLIKNKTYQSKMKHERKRSSGGSNSIPGQNTAARSKSRFRGRLASVQQTQIAQNPTPKVIYSNLLNTILQKQMVDHTAYLSSFMKLFQEADTDNDGIIDSDAFVTLYKRMNIHETDHYFELSPHVEQELNQMLVELDPHEQDKIVLSDVIRLFTNHKKESAKEQKEETNTFPFNLTNTSYHTNTTPVGSLPIQSHTDQSLMDCNNSRNITQNKYMLKLTSDGSAFNSN
jgi:hypothetical protein